MTVKRRAQRRAGASLKPEAKVQFLALGLPALWVLALGGQAEAHPELSALGAMTAASEGEITSLAAGAGLPEYVRKSAFLS